MDNVNLEIYYHPGHEYNLDRMLESAQGGLDYFETNFGPYQFTQFRVLEFPRYRRFAQSFPNTVPYSEAIGFIERVRKPEDMDMMYYVTAHELAHQWWGHQLIGSRTQGSNMMSETLAEYSALKVMEKKYGEESIRKIPAARARPLPARASRARCATSHPDVGAKRAVRLVQQGQPGDVRDERLLGEDRLNAALRGYLERSRYATGPYPVRAGSWRP